MASDFLDDQPSAPLTPAASAAPTAPVTPARAQFEAERMTRRAALRKFGFGAGMAALLALSSDDLARMAAAKLKQHAGDSKVANQVANEFRNAGLAFAEEEYNSSASASTDCTCSNPPAGYKCKPCAFSGSTLAFSCTTSACCDTAYIDCLANAEKPGKPGHAQCSTMYNECVKNHT